MTTVRKFNSYPLAGTCLIILGSRRKKRHEPIHQTDCF